MNFSSFNITIHTTLLLILFSRTTGFPINDESFPINAICIESQLDKFCFEEFGSGLPLLPSLHDAARLITLTAQTQVDQIRRSIHSHFPKATPYLKTIMRNCDVVLVKAARRLRSVPYDLSNKEYGKLYNHGGSASSAGFTCKSHFKNLKMPYNRDWFADARRLENLGVLIQAAASLYMKSGNQSVYA